MINLKIHKNQRELIAKGTGTGMQYFLNHSDTFYWPCRPADIRSRPETYKTQTNDMNQEWFMVQLL